MAVCVDALAAARQLLDYFPRFNAERRAAGRQTLEFGVALHLGEVLYGNIGASERLDFTVVGSTVNEASRIEGMCRPLQRKVLVSQSFHAAAATCGGSLTSLGFTRCAASASRRNCSRSRAADDGERRPAGSSRQAGQRELLDRRWRRDAAPDDGTP